MHHYRFWITGIPRVSREARAGLEYALDGPVLQFQYLQRRTLADAY